MPAPHSPPPTISPSPRLPLSRSPSSPLSASPRPGHTALWMRLSGLMRKEAIQIVRDPSSIAIAFLLPLVLLLIFGYGVSLDAKHVPIGVVVEYPSPQVSAFTASFEQSPYFQPRHFPHIKEAEEALRQADIKGIVWMRGNFDEQFLSGDTAPIAVFVNGVDANTARLVQGYIQGAWTTWLMDYARSRGNTLTVPVKLDQRVWFNPGLRSRDYLVPGLVAVIMTLIGALLTALVVAREWERGTMEALMVTPVAIREILIGKLVPYFILGMGGLLFSVAMAVWVFEVPLRGSMLLLLAASALFLVAALAMGLLISTLAKNQFVAALAAMLATFLPAFILSGFIFDIGSMPAPVQWLTHIIAARYYVAILQTVFLAGNVWSVVLINALALIVITGFFMAVVRRRTRKRLE
jgi:ABC-2 type transport system permease protein